MTDSYEKLADRTRTGQYASPHRFEWCPARRTWVCDGCGERHDQDEPTWDKEEVDE